MRNNLSKIFLSYNRQNLAFADTIAKRLEENNHAQIKEVFFDQDDIGGGDNWVDQIQQALSDSDTCIQKNFHGCFLTSNGLNSPAKRIQMHF